MRISQWKGRLVQSSPRIQRLASYNLSLVKNGTLERMEKCAQVRGNRPPKWTWSTYQGIHANIENAIPQSDTTTMNTVVIARSLVPFSKMRRYWKSSASLMKAVAILYKAFAT